MLEIGRKNILKNAEHTRKCIMRAKQENSFGPLIVNSAILYVSPKPTTMIILNPLMSFGFVKHVMQNNTEHVINSNKEFLYESN